MIAIAWIFFCVVFSACAAEVHVSHWQGDDSNSGASEAPVATLARGVSLLAAGDTLVIAKGAAPYYEALNLGARSGGVTNSIVVEGNGATLSGLVSMPIAEWTPQNDGTYRHPHKQRGALQPYLMDGDREVPKATLSNLLPYSHCWTTEGVWFRPAEGKTLADYQLIGTLRGSGVAINHGSYITVRNLICERFANDGFNVHGGSRGLVFENIVARFNGDDGFSIHEDVEAVVYGGHFHNNNFGIQDVNASQSVFHGLLVESNRVVGVDFYGGYHSIFDSVVRSNRDYEIRVSGNIAAHIGFTEGNPMCKGLVFLKNTEIYSGATGVNVKSGSRVIMNACTLRDLVVGLDVAANGVCHAVNTTIENCSKDAVQQAEGATVVW
ncbi:MAG: right-handed parallel beta-helix repeat-containing protein [Kiritimatiellia bacterium]